MAQFQGNFSLSEANELAHAFIAHTAQQAGIRTLAIKGRVADQYGLRPPRIAADADVMVDPSRFRDLCALLTDRGWHLRVEREVPTLLGVHSVTMIHDGWPNDLDVHMRYPGFFADDEIVFERLWDTRSEMDFAHVTVPVPSRAASAVIAALHAGRYSRSPRHSDELDRVAHLLVAKFTDEDRAEFVDVARVGRAQWVLRELFESIGVPYEVDADATQRKLWSINRATSEDGAAVSWLSGVRDASWPRKPGMLLRALWISSAEIPRNNPESAPTVREVWTHRFLRWRRGGAALRRYARLRRRSAEY